MEMEAPLESRPGIMLVGSPNVGKRTILSRLLSIDFDDATDSWTGVLCHGWKINTKYYSADVSVWTAQLDDEFSLRMLPVANMAALVMVFDLNELSSFAALQVWISGIDLNKFEILLCIGNKADLLPGHFAHVEYRRRLQKRGESSSDPHPEFLEYGITETEGSSLLGDEEPSWEIRKSCLEWCIEHNIEYVEACASNADFDKCLSVNGDMQGVDRLYGALSAHMWPGMILKSGNRVAEILSAEKEESEKSDEESEFELEYEILSRGSAEPWDGNESWADFSQAPTITSMEEGSSSQNDGPMNTQYIEHEANNRVKDFASEIGSCSIVVHSETEQVNVVDESSESNCDSDKKLVEERASSEHKNDEEASEVTLQIPAQEDSGAKVVQSDGMDESTHLEYGDLEHLMSEIGNMRDNLRLMPDFQRRDMAAKLAIKMATMFGCSSDEEGFE